MSDMVVLFTQWKDTPSKSREWCKHVSNEYAVKCALAESKVAGTC